MRYFKKNKYKPQSPSEQNTDDDEIKLTYFIFFSVYSPGVIKHSGKLRVS